MHTNKILDISTPKPLLAVHKPPHALMPPNKVIKAIQSYHAKSSQELFFTKGDFFHVVNEVNRGSQQYFEAHNPMTGSRGLVPRDLFQELFTTEIR